VTWKNRIVGAPCREWLDTPEFVEKASNLARFLLFFRGKKELVGPNRGLASGFDACQERV